MLQISLAVILHCDSVLDNMMEIHILSKIIAITRMCFYQKHMSRTFILIWCDGTTSNSYGNTITHLTYLLSQAQNPFLDVSFIRARIALHRRKRHPKMDSELGSVSKSNV